MDLEQPGDLPLATLFVSTRSEKATPLTVLLDTGSQRNIMGTTTVRLLLNRGANLTQTQLPRPVRAILADHKTQIIMTSQASVLASTSSEGRPKSFDFLVLADSPEQAVTPILSWATMQAHRLYPWAPLPSPTERPHLNLKTNPASLPGGDFAAKRANFVDSSPRQELGGGTLATAQGGAPTSPTLATETPAAVAPAAVTLPQTWTRPNLAVERPSLPPPRWTTAPDAAAPAAVTPPHAYDLTVERPPLPPPRWPAAPKLEANAPDFNLQTATAASTSFPQYFNLHTADDNEPLPEPPSLLAVIQAALAINELSGNLEGADAALDLDDVTPSPEELLRRQSKNDAAFQDLMDRTMAYKSDFADPAIFARLVGVLHRLRPRLTEQLRPEDVVTGLHVPVERQAPGTHLPVLGTRHQTPKRLALLKDWMRELIYLKAARPARVRGPCPVPCHVVGTAEKPRVVLDTKQIKDVVDPLIFDEPTPAHKLHLLTQHSNGSFQCGAKFDLTTAFHSIRANPDTPTELRQVSVGPDTYDMLCLPMGGPNSSKILGLLLNQAFAGDLYTSFFPTADDIAVPGGGTTLADGQRQLVERLEKFTEIALRHSLPLKTSKAVLYTRELEYCGNIVSPEGTRRNPNNIDAIKHVEPPTDGAQLNNLYHVAQWSQQYIPDFARRFEHIRRALDNMHADTANSKRKSKPLAACKIADYGITFDHIQGLTSALRDSATVAHRDLSKSLVLMTDASETGWGGVLFQVPPASIPNFAFMTDGSAQPLAYFGGLFDATQRAYYTTELESLAVIKSIGAGRFLLDDDSELLILTDNAGAAAVLDPTSSYVANRSGPGRARLLRWAAQISGLNVRFASVPGEANLQADALSRSRSYEEPPPHDDDDEDIPGLAPQPLGTPDRVQAVHLEHALSTTADPDWVDPSVTEIANICAPNGVPDPDIKAEAKKHKFRWDATRKLFLRDQRVYVPDKADLRRRLLALAHCGDAGHRGERATRLHLEAHYWWYTLDTDVANFVAGCAVCPLLRQALIDTTFGTIVRGDKPNKIASLDFTYFSRSESVENPEDRIIVMSDTFSNFIMARPATSEHTSDTLTMLSEWDGLFGLPDIIVFDSSPAFKNKAVQDFLAKRHRKAHYTTPHNPQSHGRLERLNREIIRTMRAYLVEHRLNPNQWRRALPSLIRTINHTPVESLAGYAPVQVFAGLAPDRPIARSAAITAVPEPTLPPAPAEILAHVQSAADTSSGRAATVETEHKRRIAATAARQAGRSHVRAPNLRKDDWVYVRKHDTSAPSKLEPRWQLARLVRRACQQHNQVWIARFVSVDAKRRATGPVHVSRIQRLAPKSYAQTPELLNLADYLENKTYAVDGFKALRLNAATGQLEILVQWTAYPADWHALADIFRDLPSDVEAFLDSYTAAPALVHQARALLGLNGT